MTRRKKVYKECSLLRKAIHNSMMSEERPSQMDSVNNMFKSLVEKTSALRALAVPDAFIVAALKTAMDSLCNYEDIYVDRQSVQTDEHTDTEAIDEPILVRKLATNLWVNSYVLKPSSTTAPANTRESETEVESPSVLSSVSFGSASAPMSSSDDGMTDSSLKSSVVIEETDSNCDSNTGAVDHKSTIICILCQKLGHFSVDCMQEWQEWQE